MYGLLLMIHSLLRWAVLALLLFGIFRAAGGWLAKRDWQEADKKVHLIGMIVVDVQLLIGLLLYFVFSPSVQSALANMKFAMKDPQLRFWAIEHFSLMLLALIAVHIGYALSKRAAEAVRKHKHIAVFYSLALLSMLASIPWPFMKVGRPLFRFIGFSS